MVTLPQKKDVALALLERASVFVHLDPRADSVRVPSWFKRQPQLVLQIGLNMAVRIPDLDVGDEAIACTLSFNRSPQYCYIPWEFVYALVGEDGRGMVWPEDIPPEVAAQTQSLSSRPRLHSVPKSDAAEAPRSRRDGKLGGQRSLSLRPAAGAADSGEERAQSVPPAAAPSAGLEPQPPVLTLQGTKKRKRSSRRQAPSSISGQRESVPAPGAAGEGASALPPESATSSSQERPARSSERPYLRLVR
jgi:stringent starvation protein B